jgi:hypothetical protein
MSFDFTNILDSKRLSGLCLAARHIGEKLPCLNLSA